jgi:hypothetical protein
MELMASCFDKLLKLIQRAIPEDVLGKLTFAVCMFITCCSFFFMCVLIEQRSNACLLDCHSIELFERDTWHYSSRFVNQMIDYCYS